MMIEPRPPDLHRDTALPARAPAEAPDGLLRLALRLDAVATGALGALLLVSGPLADELLGSLPRLPLGGFLLVYAAAIWLVAARPRISLRAAAAAVTLNLLWAVDSVLVVGASWLPLTALGTASVLAQAGVVAVFAGLQLAGLHRARRAAEPRGTPAAAPS